MTCAQRDGDSAPTLRQSAPSGALILYHPAPRQPNTGDSGAKAEIVPACFPACKRGICTLPKVVLSDNTWGCLVPRATGNLAPRGGNGSDTRSCSAEASDGGLDQGGKTSAAGLEGLQKGTEAGLLPPSGCRRGKSFSLHLRYDPPLSRVLPSLCSSCPSVSPHCYPPLHPLSSSPSLAVQPSLTEPRADCWSSCACAVGAIWSAGWKLHLQARDLPKGFSAVSPGRPLSPAWGRGLLLWNCKLGGPRERGQEAAGGRSACHSPPGRQLACVQLNCSGQTTLPAPPAPAPRSHLSRSRCAPATSHPAGIPSVRGWRPLPLSHPRVLSSRAASPRPPARPRPWAGCVPGGRGLRTWKGAGGWGWGLGWPSSGPADSVSTASAFPFPLSEDQISGVGAAPWAESLRL
ncbi:uncharacterized protein [Vicugna pacos]|uniref:Uncharacterized protein n=1 Tax=Vicugna pacos TaxID=30538 RepID=A0ABM5CXJ6_VICPA